MSSTKWKVGGSVPGYLSLDVEISLGKILNPRFSLKQMCDSSPTSLISYIHKLSLSRFVR